MGFQIDKRRLFNVFFQRNICLYTVKKLSMKLDDKKYAKEKHTSSDNVQVQIELKGVGNCKACNKF